MNKEELQRNIKSAFADVPYPGNGSLGVPEGGHDSELVENILRGRNWRTLAPSELNRITLNFMTPEAFHYYLPAYLLIAFEEQDGDPGGVLNDCLTPLELDDFGVNRRFNILFSHFSPSQKRVIVDYLKIYHQIMKGLDEEVKDGDGVEFTDDETNSFWEKLIEYWEKFSKQ